MVDENSQKFRQLFDQANISYDRFIRTTDGDHKQTVNHFWNVLKDNDAIGTGNHSGYYSTNEETFFMSKDLEQKGDDYFTSVGEKCELVEEKNYVFKVDQPLKNEIN